MQIGVRRFHAIYCKKQDSSSGAVETYCRKTILEIQQIYSQNKSRMAFKPSAAFRRNYQCLKYNKVKDYPEPLTRHKQQPK
ncbi:hypothetical protein TNCV_4714351 [Trichonephila clavipes]|nr:hypothetical protein TNCV_4714351 [Trichonephila clavipes]